VPDTQKPCKLSAVKITHLEAKRLKMNDFIGNMLRATGCEFRTEFLVIYAQRGL